jgi:hypothetical protein
MARERWRNKIHQKMKPCNRLKRTYDRTFRLYDRFVGISLGFEPLLLLFCI